MMMFFAAVLVSLYVCVFINFIYCLLFILRFNLNIVIVDNFYFIFLTKVIVDNYLVKNKIWSIK